MSSRADQWDDLAAKLVTQEHARVIGREGEAPLIHIDLAHPLVQKGIRIEVIGGAPSIGFDFVSLRFPSDDAVALMSRVGSLFSGLDPSIIVRGLREAYTNRQGGATGKGVAISGMAALSDDYFIGCFALPESTDVSFSIQRKRRR